MPGAFRIYLFDYHSLYFSFCQTPTSQADLGKPVQNLMSIEVGFEKMVPAGTSIKAIEVSRRGTSGKDLVVQYHIFVTGAPANTSATSSLAITRIQATIAVFRTSPQLTISYVAPSPP
jgi:hypothetical protein